MRLTALTDFKAEINGVRYAFRKDETITVDARTGEHLKSAGVAETPKRRTRKTKEGAK